MKDQFILPFSIIMAIIILYYLSLYKKDLEKYKKMAKEDKKELLKILSSKNESLQNNQLSINDFIFSRIDFHRINYNEYINYVFPYLVRLLKKHNLFLMKQES